MSFCTEALTNNGSRVEALITARGILVLFTLLCGAGVWVDMEMAFLLLSLILKFTVAERSYCGNLCQGFGSVNFKSGFHWVLMTVDVDAHSLISISIGPH